MTRLNPQWQHRAACRGVAPGYMFPSRGEPVGPAVEVCNACPVKVECLAAALISPGGEGYGVWGGLPARDRKRLRTALRADFPRLAEGHPSGHQPEHEPDLDPALDHDDADFDPIDAARRASAADALY